MGQLLSCTLGTRNRLDQANQSYLTINERQAGRSTFSYLGLQ